MSPKPPLLPLVPVGNPVGNDAMGGIRWMDRLPTELLIVVLSMTDTITLSRCSGVCHKWHRVIKDDACWRAALQYYYKRVPLWRLASTWKEETLSRIALGRYSKSKGREYLKGRQAIQTDPRLGAISHVHFEEDIIYLGSVLTGKVGIVHLNGKVERDSILPDSEGIASIKIEKYRIVVGSLDGRVQLITNFKDHSSPTIRDFVGFHDGPVSTLQWLPSVPGLFVSGGFDGSVRVWDVASLSCSAILHPDESSPLTFLYLDRKHVVGATVSGNILVWDVNVFDLVSKPSAWGSVRKNADPLPISEIKVSRVLTINGPISHLTYLPLYSTVVCTSGSSIHYWNVLDGQLIGQMTLSKDSTMTAAYIADSEFESDTNGVPAILGDSTGSLYLFKLLKKGLELVKHFTGHDSEIKQVSMDPFKIVSLSNDGKLKIWTTIDCQLLRTLNVRNLERALPPVETIEFEQHVTESTPVIYMTQSLIIVALGSSVKMWSFEPGVFQTPKKKRPPGYKPGVSTTPGKSVRTYARSPRQEYQLDVRDAVRKTTLEIDMEKSAKEESLLRNAKFNGDLKMNEDELVSYALMLSMSPTSKVGHSSAIPIASPSSHSFGGSSVGSHRSTGRLSNSHRSSLMDRLENEQEWEEEPVDPELERYMSPSTRSQHSDAPDELSLNEGSSKSFGGNHRGDSFTARSSHSAAAQWLSRSPRILPSTGVVVAKNVSEEDDLQYVLELSMHEK